MTPNDRLEVIEEKLDQLFAKQLELVIAYQKQAKAYEEQKTFYQKLFGQPPLPSDPKLEAINTQIADLKEDKRRIYDIIQAAASVPQPEPEKDWSKSFLYSHSIRRMFGAETPFEQYGLYASITGGTLIIIRSVFRSHHAMKAVEFAPRTDDRRFHSYLARATQEQLLDVKLFARRLRARGLFVGLLLPLGFISYILNKHSKD